MRISDWSSDVCSSDLLKPDSLRFRGLRDLEALGLALARAVGLDAAHALPVTVANRQALLIERYDRTSGSDGAIQRLHHEDFCQAMGYAGALKYENQAGPGLAACSQLARALAFGPRPTQGLLDCVASHPLIATPHPRAKQGALN